MGSNVSTILAPMLFWALGCTSAAREASTEASRKTTRSCFGVRADGHVYTAEGCCDVQRHGLGGDPGCWGYDEELGRVVNFEDCCVTEILGAGLLADRPPLILDLALSLHSDPSSLWMEANRLCAGGTRCKHVEVHLSGLRASPTTGRLEWQPEAGFALREPTLALVDVGAHVKSRYLERLAMEPRTLLIALEPDRVSCRYHLDYARRSLGAQALARFWLLPVAAAPELGFATLHRANHFFDGQCSSLLEFRKGAVAWSGCTEQTGEDIVSTMPLAEILSRLPESIAEIEMKIDVQGFDLQVLRSAGQELRRVARLTIEVQDLPLDDPRVRYVGQRNRAEIEAELRTHGFELEGCEPYAEKAALIRETDCTFVRRDLGTARQSAPLAGRLTGRTHLVTFADEEPFTTVQQRLSETATLAGFASHAKWSLKMLFDRLADGRPNPLTHIETGNWLPFKARWWKAFVILERLQDEEVLEGEWVVYQDSTHYVPQGFNASHAAALGNLLREMQAAEAHVIAGIALPTSIGWEWSQRCVPNYSLSPQDQKAFGDARMQWELCSALEGLQVCSAGDAECCATVQAKSMLQNAWLAFRKGAAGLAFAEEWLRWNVNESLMRAMPLADQSLFELVAHKSTEPLFVLESRELRPVLTRNRLRVHNGNRVKHLGVALDQLEGIAGQATVGPLASLGAPEWRREGASLTDWQRSLCRG